MSIGKISNFSEYRLKGDFATLNLPNAFSTSFNLYIVGNLKKIFIYGVKFAI